MEIEGNRESSNIDDRRGMGGSGLAIGGLGSIAVVVLGLVFGFDPRPLLQNRPQQPGAGANAPKTPEEQKQAKFVSVVLASTEDVWKDQFSKVYRKRYVEPKLVLFTDSVDSACGRATSAVGPFYCPGDSQVYIDCGFFRDMEQKLGIPGEFPRAYVIAHEVGHHVQHLLGYSARTDSKRGTPEENQYSVRLELQADYLAGVWAHYSKEKFKLNDRDIAEAINAAQQIGDDALQKRGRGKVVPDSFTHGTSEQRQKYFRDGYRTGDASPAKLDQFFSVPYGRL